MTYGMIYLIIFIIALVITLIISWYCSNKFFNQYVYVNFFTRKGYKIISVSGEEYVSCDNPISSYTNNLILL